MLELFGIVDVALLNADGCLSISYRLWYFDVEFVEKYND